jgi:SAM-dependent methyltransferase
VRRADQVIRIGWLEGGSARVACPVCRSDAPKPEMLIVESPSASLPLTLVDCRECGAAFYEGARLVAASAPDPSTATKFYVEQGAGVDVMIEPLFQVDPRRVRRSLEVGCGFGYALDFVRWAFGWDARGVDPSPLAAAGRTALGLDIAPEFLERATGADCGASDLVFCSEVIEHVPDPLAFVQVLGSHLAEDGVLVLTTPNAGAVHREAPDAMLLSVLSPGHHLVLFRPATLRRLLEVSGFCDVAIRESPGSLSAVASRHRWARREPAAIDRALYRRYLAARHEAHSPDAPVGLGFAYRLFKECVNAGEAGEALAVFERLRRAYRRGYGLDPAEPRSLAGRVPAQSFEELARACPFNVTGTLFFRGVVEFNHHGADAEALEYFRAAAAAGTAVRTALRSIGSDDGETEALVRLARVHAGYCLARFDPESALGELAAVESAPAGQVAVGAAPRPPELAATARVELFVRLVNAGHYPWAARLASSVAAAVGLDGSTTSGARGGAPPGAGAAPILSATFCLGILALNHHGEPARAARLFALAHDGARSACATGAPGPAALALLWPARYCQALALGRAGDGAGSRAAASSLIGPIPLAAGLPPVPADLQASAQELLA